MATKWVRAAMRRMQIPWAGAVVAVEREAASLGALPTRVRGQRTPEGVAAWLSFHGVEIKRPDVTASGVWRSV